MSRCTKGLVYSRKYRGNKDALGSQEGGTDGTEAGDADKGMRPQSRTTAKPDNYMWIQDGKSRRQLNMPHAEPGSIHAWKKKLQNVSGNEGHTE